MKNLFEAGRADDLKARVAQLRAESTRVWGSMTPAQAMAHCSASLEWALGERIPPRAGLMVRIMGRLIKPMVLKDDKPLRRNSPTAPDLIVHTEPNIEAERTRLCTMIDRFAKEGPDGCTTHAHSFFGPLKPNEWAILMYKHLDHHLRQFGV
jgi:hypothetical protein